MPRRSLRERKAPAPSKSVLAVEIEAEDESQSVGLPSEDVEETSSSSGSIVNDDESEDEWRPQTQKKPRKTGRGRGESPSSEGDYSDDIGLSGKEDQNGIKSSSSRKRSKIASESTPSGKRKREKDKMANTETSVSGHAKTRLGDDYDEEIDEEERVMLQEEAEAAWGKVRQRKEVDKGATGATFDANPQAASTSTNTHVKVGLSNSLNSWLGLPSIPWPTSPESARVQDRDSLFIGFVYPITSSTPSTLAQHLNHLSTIVHPTLPASIFPDMLSHLDPKRRGSSHDIQAWRVLELKRGRDGLGGPNDFGLEEGSDDDGERWGGERLLRVAREMGAVDIFVVVSRWYGGTNLGPVRFDHMALCAREAIRAYMLEETLIPLRKELHSLDEEIISLRNQLSDIRPPSMPSLSPSKQREAVKVSSPERRTITTAYEDLVDAEKGNRLLTARKKTIEMLKRRLEEAHRHRHPSQSSKVVPEGTSSSSTSIEVTPSPPVPVSVSVPLPDSITSQGNADTDTKVQKEKVVMTFDSLPTSSSSPPPPPPPPPPPSASLPLQGTINVTEENSNKDQYDHNHDHDEEEEEEEENLLQEWDDLA